MLGTDFFIYKIWTKNCFLRVQIYNVLGKFRHPTKMMHCFTFQWQHFFLNCANQQYEIVMFVHVLFILIKKITNIFIISARKQRVFV